MALLEFNYDRYLIHGTHEPICQIALQMPIIIILDFDRVIYKSSSTKIKCEKKYIQLIHIYNEKKYDDLMFLTQSNYIKYAFKFVR